MENLSGTNCNSEMAVADEQSFHEIDEQPALNELMILMRVERGDGSPLPVGSYSEHCVVRKIEGTIGLKIARATHINPYDTVIEVTNDVSVVAISLALHQIREWEDFPVEISCIMGKKNYINEVCQHRIKLIEQKAEIAQQAEQMRTESELQRNALAELIDRVNDQARMVGELQEAQSHAESVPRISSSMVTPTYADVVRASSKMTKTPDIPLFSGELPTPKGEVEFDNWIFQLKSLRKTYTDDAIRNGVVSHVRGIAKTVVRAIGYESDLPEMLRRLEDRLGFRQTDDCLLLEFHQMMQGPHEKIQDYGSKLECKFKFLQERFPGRYADVQLKDRFFSGMNDKLRDSMRYLYDNNKCSFGQMLKSAMRAEGESASRAATRAKAAVVENAGTSNEGSNSEITSIRAQLSSMSKILKGAQFHGTADVRQNLKGPGTSAAGPFKTNKPPIQCHRCFRWGHFKRSCPNKEPVEGSVEWGNLHGEVDQKGGTIPQTEKDHPK